MFQNYWDVDNIYSSPAPHFVLLYLPAYVDIMNIGRQHISRWNIRKFPADMNMFLHESLQYAQLYYSLISRYSFLQMAKNTLILSKSVPNIIINAINKYFPE